jgi:N-acetylneuraminic acid mutarotase
MLPVGLTAVAASGSSAGWGYDAAGDLGHLNDLWEFNPSTNKWAWMSGSSTEASPAACAQYGAYGTLGTPAAGNTPGGREQATGNIDGQGNFLLFGGIGAGAPGNNGLLNDLWKFSPS